MSINQVITEYTGNVPDRDNPDTFDGDVDNYLTYTSTTAPQINQWAVEANSLADSINSTAGDVETDKLTVEEYKDQTLAYRDESEVFKNSAAAAAAAAQAGAGLPSVGNDDDVLTLIDSATNTVAFRPRGKSGLVPLLTVTASGDSAIDFTDLDTYGYDNFFILSTLSSSAASTNLYINTSTDNGVYFTPNSTGNYTSVLLSSRYNYINDTNNTIQDGVNGSALISPLYSSQNTTITVGINSALDSSAYTRIKASSISTLNNVISDDYNACFRLSNEVNNAIRLVTSAGTITGKITLYGVSDA